MKEKTKEIIFFIGILLLVGSVGGADVGTMSFGLAVIGALAGLGLMALAEVEK